MGLLNLLGNAVEGVGQIATNTVKLPVAMVLAPFDDGDAVADGFEKVGDDD